MVKEKEKKTTKNIFKDTGNNSSKLILHNDNYNRFDYVVFTLMEECNYDREQAEQCTLIAHLKGKCVIKTGNLKELKLISRRLSIKGLNTTIE